MPDPYASIAQADEALQVKLAEVLELRAADPQQRTMIDAYLSALELPKDAVALEVGCGTGAVTRILATMPGIEKVVGIDASSVFIERARSLGGRLSHLSFETGDVALWRSATPRSTSSSSIRLCAICPTPSRRFVRPTAFFAPPAN